mmetsp:Transcript_38645/g.83243  ORF Transcript_38645/g.83243 Transcript_38645/m.83243 type:complete len:228 (-) Transcript_38645:91-774(-)
MAQHGKSASDALPAGSTKWRDHSILQPPFDASSHVPTALALAGRGRGRSDSTGIDGYCLLHRSVLCQSCLSDAALGLRCLRLCRYLGAWPREHAGQEVGVLVRGHALDLALSAAGGGNRSKVVHAYRFRPADGCGGNHSQAGGTARLGLGHETSAARVAVPGSAHETSCTGGVFPIALGEAAADDLWKSGLQASRCGRGISCRDVSGASRCLPGTARSRLCLYRRLQ